jgi:hypothetical protein
LNGVVGATVGGGPPGTTLPAWRNRRGRRMVNGMSTQYERDDFSVVVKSKGQPPKRWKWEIYRAGRSSAVEQSTTFFSTMTAAHRAGKEALAQLFKELETSRF